MSFADAVATQPTWVQVWVQLMGIVIIGSVIVLLFSRATRRDALIVILAMAVTSVAVLWLFQKIGYVRLLGLAHVVFWTPLALYLWRRLKDLTIVVPFRQIIWLLLATITVSLAFDYVDTVRYLLGERDSLVVSR